MSIETDFKLIGFEPNHPFHAYILSGPPRYWQPSLDQIVKQLTIDRLDQWVMINEPITNIDLIRRIEKIVAQKPINSQYKLVAINGLTISYQATNALLKTIEEPKGDSIIVIATQPNYDLPPTVISRCQIIKVRSSNPTGLDGPGGARDWPTAQQIQQWDIITRFEFVENYLKTEKDQRASDLLDFWLNGLYATYEYRGQPSLASDLLLAKEQVAQNVQPRLVLECLMLKI